MLVVIGPTGNVGAEVAQLVVNESPLMPYRLAAHSPERVKATLGPDTHIVSFDYDDRSTWDAVLEEVEVLFLLFPLPSPRTVNTRMKPFIDAAVEAGVQHIVYVSVPGADTQKVVPHHYVERHIKSKNVGYTILRPTYFMQNLCRKISSHGVDIMENDEVFIPAKDGETTFIDARDVAAVALDVIKNYEAHDGQEYLLTGPQKLDFYQVAEIFSEVLERPIRYTNPSMPAFWWRLIQRGKTWDVILFMTIVYFLTRTGKNAQESDTLPKMLGREPKTMREFLVDYLPKFENREWT